MAGGGIKQNNLTIQGGADGATFLPSVDANGNLSWSNNKGYSNPQTVNIKGPKGDKGEDGEDGIVSIAQVQTLISEAKQSMHPVGSFYITTQNENPAQILGFGTWEKIEGKMILGANNTYPAGSVGGNATHTLSKSELPNYYLQLKSGAGTTEQIAFITDEPSFSFYGNHGSMTSSQTSGGVGFGEPSGLNSGGEGQAFSILGPYFAAYIWHRTA